ncbi:D-alanyl-D-alanine carboxypeptidase family protein [Paenibacillus contaminans]|uniref:D-alanyl-D-alanine carboxypeptidase family protein n=2 Tax=Paenibacillus contaminans TaxID=450362 RepID=A0A329MN21_9BACL|nr:M15 family metallopeptidase [Paenibacillus contaminans]RAV21351.1 D-alanyl-D-alanine carboxypeptidase family protein [Paenibacillus contaminans]
MMNKRSLAAMALLISVSLLSACGKDKAPAGSPAPSASPSAAASQSPTAKPTPTAGSPSASSSVSPSAKPSATPGKNDGVQVIAKPESITVLVNKQNMLPDNYNPTDLVYPDIPFTFKEKLEKRKMRKEAAEAIEQLFAGAKKDDISLAGVSAYRSHATQTSLFNSYVKKDGLEKAKTYSAVPGTSEHETGLAIDVSGSDGKCAAQDCFGGTKEAKWLAEHAHEYGFIIRYPKGKDKITGYQYEPWHIRYVGTKMAKEIADKGSTLEEHLNAVPVSK